MHMSYIETVFYACMHDIEQSIACGSSINAYLYKQSAANAYV
jgi:hypothetical protein